MIWEFKWKFDLSRTLDSLSNRVEVCLPVGKE